MAEDSSGAAESVGRSGVSVGYPLVRVRQSELLLLPRETRQRILADAMQAWRDDVGADCVRGNVSVLTG